jgi:hypothetical protein
MHRVGDYRQSPDAIPISVNGTSTDVNPTTTTWSKIDFQFQKPGYPTDTNDSEHNIVSVNGVVGKTLTVMTTDLTNAIVAQVKTGRRLAIVTVYRGSGFDQNCILCDTTAGRNNIEFSCSSLLKLQNVTLADSTATGNDSGDRCSITNIHRNPLNGFVYSFRNAQPRFKETYLTSKLQAEQDVVLPLATPWISRYAGVSAVPTMGSAGGQEFKIPPPTPSTIFANSSGKSSVSISPGGHKTFSQKEYYSGPFNSFLDRYTPRDAPYGGFHSVPGGKCLMVALKPQYRTSTSESIEMETEHTYVYAARMSRAKVSIMPMQNTLA